MSNKSRRRMKMAAGAILAGAAIPIAAAGTAWADDSAQADATETASQLEHQGLTKAEAQAVVTAENGTTTPVQVSYDGTIVVNANQGGTLATDATATSGTGPKDVAAAIGDASVASAGAGTDECPSCELGYIGQPLTGKHDTAFADGAIAYAFAGDGNGDKAIANGDSDEASATGGNDDHSTVTGSYSTADTGGSGNNNASHDTATVTNGYDTQAWAGTPSGYGGSDDKAIAEGTDSEAGAGGDFDRDKAEALGSYLDAFAVDKNGQHVIVRPEDMTPVIDAHSMPAMPLP